MKFGFVLPGGSASEQLAQAIAADRAGWDGVFVWEAAYGVDAWTLLSAISQHTTHIKLGTMLTPLPWRRPWKVASQATTLDELSDGRAILGVGLGATDAVLGRTGEMDDRRTRAELLDEGIDVITGLWDGRLVYSGVHYDIDLTARSELIARRRVPIWCVGAWPRPKSMRRILRCDGWLPNAQDEDGNHRALTPDDVHDAIGWLDANGGRRDSFDVIVEGETTSGESVRQWADAGATWWLDARWQVGAQDRDQVVLDRLGAGPPHV